MSRIDHSLYKNEDTYQVDFSMTQEDIPSEESNHWYFAAHSYQDRPWMSRLIKPISISDRIARAAGRWGSHICLREVDPFGRIVDSVTYQQLRELVQDRAKTLWYQGASSSMLIGVQVRNSLDSLIDILAILALESAPVLIDVNEAKERRSEQFQTLCHAILESGGAEKRLIQVEMNNHTDLIGNHSGKQQIAFVLYTTGSTAASKAVAQSHYAVTINTIATARHHLMRPGEVMACALPVSHVNGLHFGVLATLFTGGTCLLFQTFEPLTYLQVLDREHAKRATTVPSLLRTLLDVRKWPSLSEFAYFISAAAPLSASVAAGIFERSAKQVVQGYGMSECMNFATTMPIHLPMEDYIQYVLDAAIPPVGHELFGCEVTIQNNLSQEAPEGEMGEVHVRGHSVMSGYIGNPSATVEAFGQGWLRTGDIGKFETSPDQKTRWLTLSGRIKNIAKCNALSISLEELDRWLLTLPGIVDACCIARPDQQRGEAISVFYVPQTQDLNDSDIVTHVSRRFDCHRIGLNVSAVCAIPRLRTGKIDRQTLRRRIENDL